MSAVAQPFTSLADTVNSNASKIKNPFSTGYSAGKDFFESQRDMNVLNQASRLNQQQADFASQSALNSAAFSNQRLQADLEGALQNLDIRRRLAQSDATASFAARGLGGKSTLAIQNQILSERDRSALDSITNTMLQKTQNTYQTQLRQHEIRTQSLLSDYKTQLKTYEIKKAQTRNLVGTGIGLAGTLLGL